MDLRCELVSVIRNVSDVNVRLCLLCLITTLLSLCWVFAVPLDSPDYWSRLGNWFPDEADHLSVVRFWSANGQPPPYGPSYYTSQHPPLYYILAGILYRSAGASFLAVRLCSVAPLDERKTEALVVAMALAPGVYVRNRMFDFYARTGAQKARSRASVLRGIVPQVARATTLSLTFDGSPHSHSGEPTWVLRYRIQQLHLSRVVELTPAELSALRILCAKANVAALPVSDDDRARVDGVLARLLDLGDIAKAAHEQANAVETTGAPLSSEE